jgi:formylmethanofuran dehydrogenase subunit E
MPLGLRAGLAAMAKLGVARAKNQELRVIAETGKGHAMGCFLDGVMTATGCTYGKANIEKRYWNKLAFTLIDNASGRAVRVAVKPAFIEAGLNGPFVKLRKQGVQPQDVDPAVVNPLVDKVLSGPTEDFLDIGEVFQAEVPKTKGTFDVVRCARCGEAVFVNKARVGANGEMLCVPCAGYGE